jgi:hypothetical protein
MVLQYCYASAISCIGQGIGFPSFSVIASTLELIPSICPEISLIKIICSLAIDSNSAQNIF